MPAFFLPGLSLGYIFNKLRLPSLIGMLLTGIIPGPFALNLISPSLLGISIELRQIALVIILITAPLRAWGIDKSYKKLLEKDYSTTD